MGKETEAVKDIYDELFSLQMQVFALERLLQEKGVISYKEAVELANIRREKDKCITG